MIALQYVITEDDRSSGARGWEDNLEAGADLHRVHRMFNSLARA